jgi:methyl-accepting chemotaxis protein
MLPLPSYAEHREGATEIGKLSAEAVVRDYEAAAKEIEAMGAELQDAARRCEAMTSRVHQMVAEVKDLAADYREEGKRIFLQIEDVTLMTEEVRKTCTTLKGKIAPQVASTG